MKTATSIREVTTLRTGRKAFTLIELLVVISIIAIIAGLVVGLAGVAGKGKKEKRTRVELAKLVTLIEAYKSKVGMYPPDNPSDPDRNSLLYELSGAIRDRSNPADPKYITPSFDPDGILTSEIWALYGGTDVFPSSDQAGLINAVESGTERDPDSPRMHRLLVTLRQDQYAKIGGQYSLVVPVDGPNGRPSPWSYLRGTNAVHNPDSFDLWVDIVVGGQTNRIGNWKS
jgi:prepilin-type N-terminal cleavage/methylation domain-containing protein